MLNSNTTMQDGAATTNAVETAVTTIDVQALFVSHQNQLLHFVRRYVRTLEDAEDVVQNTFIECVRSAHRYSGLSKPSTWLFGIAQNMARNYVRSRCADRCTSADLDFDSLAGDCADPAALVEHRQLLDLAGALWDGLPAKLRDTYEPIIADDSSYEQVANLLEIPIGTVRSRVSRVREKMRTLM